MSSSGLRAVLHRRPTRRMSRKLDGVRDSNENLEARPEGCDWTYTSVYSGRKIGRTISVQSFVSGQSRPADAEATIAEKLACVCYGRRRRRTSSVGDWFRANNLCGQHRRRCVLISCRRCFAMRSGRRSLSRTSHRARQVPGTSSSQRRRGGGAAVAAACDSDRRQQLLTAAAAAAAAAAASARDDDDDDIVERTAAR